MLPHKQSSSRLSKHLLSETGRALHGRKNAAAEKAAFEPVPAQSCGLPGILEIHISNMPTNSLKPSQMHGDPALGGALSYRFNGSAPAKIGQKEREPEKR